MLDIIHGLNSDESSLMIDIENAIRQIDNVEDVDSLVSTRFVYNNNDQLIIDGFLTSDKVVDHINDGSITNLALQNRQYASNFISKDGKYIAFVVNPLAIKRVWLSLMIMIAQYSPKI